MKTKAEPVVSTTTSTVVADRGAHPFFAKIADPSPTSIQAKLTVGRPGDRFEVDADAAADNVVRGEPVSAPIAGVTPAAQLRVEVDETEVQAEPEERADAGLDVQTEAEEEEVEPELQAEVEEDAEPEVQAEVEEEDAAPELQAEVEEDEAEPEVQAEAEQEEAVQAKSMQPAPGPLGAAGERELRASRGQGSPLPDAVRVAMEAAFGADFGPVRVHTDPIAARLARNLRAKAFAHGRDLFFGAGRFSPATREGQRLLAHELTHTIQQGAVKPREPEPIEDAAATPQAGAVAPVLDQQDAAPAESSQPPTASEVDGPQAEDAGAGAAPGAADSEVAVELPEVQAAVPEVVAPIPKVALDGPSDQALGAFTRATPSEVAVTQPSLGVALTDKMRSEQKAEAADAPVLEVVTAGRSDEGLTSPDEIPLPGDAKVSDGVVGADPAPLAAKPHENQGETPSAAKGEALLDQQDKGGGLLGWLRSNFRAFLDRVPTRDAGLVTSAGDRPSVPLEGKADPGRMETQRADASRQLQQQRDASTQAIKKHPGQQNIQPKQLDEKRPVALSVEEPAPIETTQDDAVADYAAAPLPADVRARADSLIQPSLHANLAKSRAASDSAAAKRDADKKAAIDKAREDTRAANVKADRDQRAIVVKSRQDVAKQQQKGIEDAHGEVDAFHLEADKEQVAARKEVADRAADSERKARGELEKGEAEAAKKKKEGEKQAAAEKKKLEESQKKQSWWERAKSAIKSAVKAVTAAIDKVFTAIRSAVKSIIDFAKKAAIGLINAARDWIVAKLDKFRDWAKGMVDKYLKDRFPALAAAINKGIDATVDVAIKAVNVVADAAVAVVEAVANVVAKVLDKVLSVYQTALKAAVQVVGAVLTGDFAEALRIAIRAACDIAGIDSKPIFDFIDRAASAVMNILKHPVRFFANLISAVGGGVRSFAKNIQQHLIKGLLGWLTGALSETDIQMPEKFDFKGILGLVMQVLGLTYENIKARVIKRYPPSARVFGVVEKTFEIVRKLVVEGPIALWKQVQASLTNLKEMVLGGIRDFVITTVVKEGMIWLLSLLNPAGAIAKVVKLLFDFVMFLVERFQQIKDFVLSVYNSLTAIASGALGKAIAAVEQALSRSLPVVISLLARLAGLGGIGKTVKKLIGKVTKPINKVVDKVIDKVVKFAKKLLKKGKAGAKKLKDKVVQWWKIKRSFKAKDGQSHTLFLKGQAASAVVTVRSEEQPYASFLKRVRKQDGLSAQQKSKLAAADKVLAKIDAEKKKPLPTSAAKKKAAADKKQATLKKLFGELEKHTSELFGGEKPKRVPVKYSPGPMGFGGTMTAKNLYGVLEGGSPPNDKSDTYDKLNHRRTSKGHSYYVRGHLLNERMGGPGKWKNMTPLSRRGNSQHEKQVESAAKNAIAADEIVDYVVKPIYGRPARSADFVQGLAQGRTPEDATKLQGVVEAEVHVPKSLDCQIHWLAKQGDQWKRVKSKKVSVDNPIELDASTYHLGSGPKFEPVKLSTQRSRLSELSAHPSAPGSLTDSVAKIGAALDARSKPFRTYADLARALFPKPDGKADPDGKTIKESWNGWIKL